MWSELLERYQALIVGGLGFAGVIITLLINAWQTRKQRREERRHERQTLRAALIEELRINREALVNNMNIVKDDVRDAGGYAVPTDAMDDAYRTFIHRIGLLSQVEVSKVMNAYLSLRTYDAKLLLIGVAPQTSDRHVRVPVENGPIFVKMSESIIGPIEKAIGVMERARDAGSGRRIWASRPQRG